VGCLGCHSGPHFSGPEQPIGQGNYQKFPVIADASLEAKYGFSKDLGRFEVTKQEADKNLWRVPTWRNVAVTAPYFHNGSVGTLDEAVRVMAKTQLNRTLKEEEVQDLVAFLNSLTGKFPAQKMPRLPDLANASVVE
jgi:cytochrome c peroxidase